MLLGCAAVSDGLNVTLTSLDDIPAQDISIAYDHINHNLNLHGAQGMTAELYSLVGNSLSSTRCTDTCHNYQHGRDLAPGFTFLRILGYNPIIQFISFIIH
jgi:hypothetical protein